MESSGTRIEGRILDYLHGRSFSDGYRMPLGGRHGTADRLTLLSRLAAGRRVIDVGCTDHLDQIDRKIDDQTWLHGILAAKADRCLGIDVDSAAVAEVVNRGWGNIICADIAADVIPEIDQSTWDLVVFGEIVEHLDDPVAFLRSIERRYGPRLPELVITVPNALSAQNIRAGIRGIELINSDHRWTFTPYTLAKVLVRAGYRPYWFTFVDSFPMLARRPGPLGLVRRKIRELLTTVAHRAYPAGRTDLVMLARHPDA